MKHIIEVVKEENGQRYVTCEIAVQDDGSLNVMVDDDFYNGTVSRDDAIELAGQIRFRRVERACNVRSRPRTASSCDIKCAACGDEDGPHGLIGRLLLCELCMESAETVATLFERPPVEDVVQYVRVILQAATNLQTRPASPMHDPKRG